MNQFFLIVTCVLLGLMLLLLARAIIGPTVIDRLVAVNMIGTKAAVVLVLIGLVFDRVDMFVDISIAYGLLNFIASIAAAKFFQHQKTMRPENQWKDDMS